MKLLPLLTIVLALLSSSFSGLPVQNTVKIEDPAAKKTELLLFYTPWCPYSQKVLNYLQRIHKSLPMRNIQNDPAGKELLKSKGGKSQVPCLFINGKALYESEQIIQWISEHQDILSAA